MSQQQQQAHAPSRGLTPRPIPISGEYESSRRSFAMDGVGVLATRSSTKPAVEATKHMSLESLGKKEGGAATDGAGGPPPPSNRYTIYDLKSVTREISTVFDAAENGDNRAITKFSKGKNFDVDAKDRYGRTALIWAADCGHLHSVETLIRLGATVHAADSHTGRTAIHWAARAGNLPIVKHLVQYGANYKKEDRFGLTPLFLAKSKGSEGEEVFKYLLAEGAPYNETKATIDVATIEAEIAAEMAKFGATEFDSQESTTPNPAVAVLTNSD